jgi:hypothetical protein
VLQDVGVQAKLFGALFQEDDFLLERQHQDPVVLEELAQAPVLGEQFEEFAGPAVGLGPQLHEIVPLDPAHAEQTVIE